MDKEVIVGQLYYLDTKIGSGESSLRLGILCNGKPNNFHTGWLRFDRLPSKTLSELLSCSLGEYLKIEYEISCSAENDCRPGRILSIEIINDENIGIEDLFFVIHEYTGAGYNGEIIGLVKKPLKEEESKKLKMALRKEGYVDEVNLSELLENGYNFMKEVMQDDKRY